ncbi:MAG: ATP-dependent protease ATPase subunit HslU [Deltaproteobacteria bacterium]|nr:ATP-dependent protease ATPase subunit HslU [Deltaproteobacteria bacterium]
MRELAPRDIVRELDRYVIGQAQAKRAVAIALRNRWRRQMVPEPLREEIAPKNIIMIGPTGVGKTEIARRLARLAHAPFIKVEASKFTEVGYVGRDVESMIRDLTELAVKMERDDAKVRVQEDLDKRVFERLLDLLLAAPADEAAAGAEKRSRAALAADLRAGALEDRLVEVETSESIVNMQIYGLHGAPEEAMGPLKDLLDGIEGAFPKRQSKQKVPVKEARKIALQEIQAQLIDRADVAGRAIERVEQSGIVFIDEIDKIAGRESSGHAPDVSRGGVQRDLLPIVEGSTVPTKHGMVRTDHILFIAAGAFSVRKPSDLIPELQGRFPIRVELQALTRADFERILVEPQSSLITQYRALLETEGVAVDFDAEAIAEIAGMAEKVNAEAENIGARRLHTVMEKLLEELSFSAPEIADQSVRITRAYVRERLADLVASEDLSRFIL